MPLGNSNLPEFFGYLWVMDLRKGMGYWLSESMGYARKMPANQHGSPGNVWVTGEYGLSGVWLIGETTVHLLLLSIGAPPSPTPSFLFKYIVLAYVLFKKRE